VTDADLQESFGVDCDNILLKINGIINPEPYVDDDMEPPIIILTPSMTIADGDAIGGLLMEWQISDFSGIAEASVQANGVTIAFYGLCESISDSILFPNVPGTTTIIVYARDNDNDPEHPDGVDWLETTAQSVITVYDDDISDPLISITYSGEGHTAAPGQWSVSIEDMESGIAEVQILVNGEEVLNQQLNGISSISYDIPVPAIEGVHDIDVNVKNNDNDWLGDEEASSETSSKEILFWIDPGDPPVIIIG